MNTMKPGFHPLATRLACTVCGWVISAVPGEGEYNCVRCHVPTAHVPAPPRNDPPPRRVSLL